MALGVYSIRVLAKKIMAIPIMSPPSWFTIEIKKIRGCEEKWRAKRGSKVAP